MAVRSEDLPILGGSRIYRFPVERAQARRLRAERLRRTKTVAAGLVVIMAVLLAGGPAAVPQAQSGRTPRAVVVQPSDTLWGLAERYAPASMDPRAWIDAVSGLNDLEGPLQAGDRLRLPR
jgi:hypothetical protein